MNLFDLNYYYEASETASNLDCRRSVYTEVSWLRIKAMDTKRNLRDTLQVQFRWIWKYMDGDESGAASSPAIHEHSLIEIIADC